MFSWNLKSGVNVSRVTLSWLLFVNKKFHVNVVKMMTKNYKKFLKDIII